MEYSSYRRVLSLSPLNAVTTAFFNKNILQVYLVHMVLVVFTYLLVPFPIIYTTKWPIFGHCLVQLILSYLFGIICALLAELPALNLERIIFQHEHKKTTLQLPKDYGLQQSKTADIGKNWHLLKQGGL